MAHIVITTIFPATEAIRLFSKLTQHNLIVVGDKKTPSDWFCDGVDYISATQQQTLRYALARQLPYNHYCRKMIGYLRAIEQGAEVIIDTDDDNFPKENWHFPNMTGQFETITEEQGFINVYQLFTKQKIWPRGLPVSLINKQFDFTDKISTIHCSIGIWQGLADGDPDVDAIYRLTNNQHCVFDDRPPIVLSKGTLCPFNSQNTLFKKELFTLLYLPTSVTFRFTDILRGLVAQPIMWTKNLRLGFSGATVTQHRNTHDLSADFESEIPMYLLTEKVVSIVSDSIDQSANIADNLYNAYHALAKEHVVESRELETLSAWLNDIQALASTS